MQCYSSTFWVRLHYNIGFALELKATGCSVMVVVRQISQRQVSEVKQEEGLIDFDRLAPSLDARFYHSEHHDEEN